METQTTKARAPRKAALWCPTCTGPLSALRWCRPCRARWSARSLDATSAYAQARIDGDPAALTLRRSLRRAEERRTRAHRLDASEVHAGDDSIETRAPRLPRRERTHAVTVADAEYPGLAAMSRHLTNVPTAPLGPPRKATAFEWLYTVARADGSSFTVPAQNHRAAMVRARAWLRSQGCLAEARALARGQVTS